MSNYRKITRGQVRSTSLKLLKEQGGLCAVCLKPIDLSIKGEMVLDHSHDTGLIRGVLHRSCNSSEGKVANAAGRWGAKSMDYKDIIQYLKQLIQYLEKEPTNLIYYNHLTEEEKRVQRNTKERKRRAERKAREAVKAKVG
ncbi:putative DNA endonuclease VII [Proteus phage PM16]|uniref:Putative DNA endonuclease VII n=1 Tax=Proteus phage PM16 TaxID=1357704 RepID=A0A0A6ZK87_9CAUD|nr:endonuclease VII [Proteus phage PM16]AGZ17269.1 putative DNA endonuclease VII [Proteus phage PM16]